jgi:nucleoside-diphosphate-sugar epimerase
MAGCDALVHAAADTSHGGRFVWGRDDTTALPQLVEAVRSRRFAWIGGGRYLTDSTHIANLCNAVMLAWRKGRGGEVYFITDGERVMFRDFITALLDTQGIAAPDKSMPRVALRMIASVGDLLGRVLDGRIQPPLTLQQFAASAVEVTLNIGKAERELGYAPVMSRAQGIDEMRAARKAA